VCGFRPRYLNEGGVSIREKYRGAQLWVIWASDSKAPVLKDPCILALVGSQLAASLSTPLNSDV